MASNRSVALYFKSGKSDKVYHISIEPSGKLYVVNFSYGRRGGNMTPGTKTDEPVDLAEAEDIFDKLVAKQKGKGYKEGTESAAAAAPSYTHKDPTQTDINCQLLNPIDEDECERYLSDDNYWAQEKLDGWRVIIRKNGTNVDGINRKGKTRDLPSNLIAEALGIQYDFIIDGELIGEQFFAFDILYENIARGNNYLTNGRPYADRIRVLRSVLTEFPLQSIKAVETAKTKAEKTKLMTRLRKDGREGIVFKLASAGYSAGRPSSGGSQVKHKFYSTCTCIVAAGRKGKRSVALELFDGKERISVGNVTIPPNKDVPSVGEKVEIRYLYAYKGGSLYQPIYIGPRDDIDDNECTTKQLKYKSETDE